MAESGKTLTLAEQYALPKEELSSAKVPVEATAAASPTNVAAEASPTNVAAEDKANPIITTTNVEDVIESPTSAVAEVVTENPTSNSPEEVSVESVVSPTTEEVVEKTDEIAPAEDSKEAPEEEAGEEVAPEIKLETAPADFRFPTTNQSRHCFTRYVEYHRCIAAKGESAPECDKFAKYYRSLCPGEWVDRWNEQRENGTFPGPL